MNGGLVHSCPCESIWLPPLLTPQSALPTSPVRRMFASWTAPYYCLKGEHKGTRSKDSQHGGGFGSPVAILLIQGVGQGAGPTESGDPAKTPGIPSPAAHPINGMLPHRIPDPPLPLRRPPVLPYTVCPSDSDGADTGECPRRVTAPLWRALIPCAVRAPRVY